MLAMYVSSWFWRESDILIFFLYAVHYCLDIYCVYAIL